MSDDATIDVYKYCTPETAVQILTEKTLRWSSPDAFGDPFELSSTTGFDLHPDSLLDATVKLASSMLFSSAEPKGDTPIVNAIKRWRTEERFANPEEAYGILKELLEKVVLAQTAHLENTQAKWRQFVRDSRICCFCDKPDNVLAWEKYAANHSGLTLKFTVRGRPSFPLPKHVNYSNDTAQLTNVREQLSAIMYRISDKTSSRFNEQFLSKGPHQKSERELRSISSAKKPIPQNHTTPSEWFDDIPFEPAELTGVYLGLSSNEALQASIKKLLISDFNHTKLYQMKKANSGYSLDIGKSS